MITNDNLRLFLTLEHGLKQVRILAALEFGPLAFMGVAKGADQLQQVLEAGFIDHYINCSGDPFLGNCRVEVIEKTPKAMVERLEKAVRNSETLPPYITVCSTTMLTREGLDVIHDWFEVNKREAAASAS